MKKVDIFPEALFTSLVDIPMFSRIDRSDLDDLPSICNLYSYEPGEKNHTGRFRFRKFVYSLIRRCGHP